MTLPFWTPKPGYTSLSLKQIQDEFGCVILTPTPLIPIPTPPFVPSPEPSLPKFSVTMVNFTYDKTLINETNDTTVTFSYTLGNRGSKTVYAKVLMLGTTTDNDFVGATNFTINADSGTIPITAKADSYSDGEEKFRMVFSESASFLGTDIYVSPIITIADSSKTPPPSLVILPAVFDQGQVGKSYTLELTVTGGDGNHVVVVSNNSLPPGLELTKVGSKYRITGIPQTPNTYNFRLTANGVVDSGIGNKECTIVIIGASLSITPLTLPPGKLSEAYSQKLTASGGNGIYTFTLSSGSLPAGINFVTASGTISGTPTVSGSSSFRISVTDTNVGTGFRDYSLLINSPVSLSILPETINAGRVGTAYEQILSVSVPAGETPVPPYTWTLNPTATTNNGLPTGVTGVVQGTGNFQYKISGIPADGTMNNYKLDFTVKNSGTSIGSRSYTLTIIDRDSTVITIQPPGGASELTLAIHNIPYEVTLGFSGSVGGTLTWAIDGTLPPGLSLESSTGKIKGIPNLTLPEQLFTFTVKVTNTLKGSGSLRVSIRAVKFEVLTSSTNLVSGKTLTLDLNGSVLVENLTVTAVNPNTETPYYGPLFLNNGTNAGFTKLVPTLTDVTVPFAILPLPTKQSSIRIFSQSSDFNWPNSAGWDSSNSFLYVRGVKTSHVHGRGHTVAIINNITGILEDIATYDTYGDDAAFGTMIAKLNSVAVGKWICIYSFDAVRINQSLRHALTACFPLGTLFNSLAAPTDITSESYNDFWDANGIWTTQNVHIARASHSIIGRKGQTSTETIKRGVATQNDVTFNITETDTVNVTNQTIQFALYGTYKSTTYLLARSSTVTVTPSTAQADLVITGPDILVASKTLNGLPLYKLEAIKVTSEPGDTINYEYLPPGSWYLDNKYFDYYPDVAAAWEKDSQGKTKVQFASDHYNNYGKAEGRYSPDFLINPDFYPITGGTMTTNNQGYVDHLIFFDQVLIPRVTLYRWTFQSTKTKKTATYSLRFYSGKLSVTLDPPRKTVTNGEEVKVKISGAGAEGITATPDNAGLSGATLQLDVNGQGFCVLIPAGSTVTDGTYNWKFTGSVSEPALFSVIIGSASFTITGPSTVYLNSSNQVVAPYGPPTPFKLTGVPHRAYSMLQNGIRIKIYVLPESGVATVLFSPGDTDAVAGGPYTYDFKDSVNDIIKSITFSVVKVIERVQAGPAEGTAEPTIYYDSEQYTHPKDKSFKFKISGGIQSTYATKGLSIRDSSNKEVAIGNVVDIGPFDSNGIILLPAEKIPATVGSTQINLSSGTVVYTFNFKGTSTSLVYRLNFVASPDFKAYEKSRGSLSVTTNEGVVNSYNPTEPIFITVEANPGDSIRINQPTYDSYETIVVKNYGNFYAKYTIQEGTWTYTSYSGFRAKTAIVTSSGKVDIDVHGGETSDVPVLTQFQKDVYAPTGTFQFVPGSDIQFNLAPDLLPPGPIFCWTGRKLEPAYKYTFTVENLTSKLSVPVTFWVRSYTLLRASEVTVNTNYIIDLEVEAQSINENSIRTIKVKTNEPINTNVYTIESSSAIAYFDSSTLTFTYDSATQYYISNVKTLAARAVTANTPINVIVRRNGQNLKTWAFMVINTGGSVVPIDTNPIQFFGFQILLVSGFYTSVPCFEVKDNATNVKVEIFDTAFFPDISPGSYTRLYNGLPTNDEFSITPGLRRGNLTSAVNSYTGPFMVGTLFSMRIWASTASGIYTETTTFTGGSQSGGGG